MALTVKVTAMGGLLAERRPPITLMTGRISSGGETGGIGGDGDRGWSDCR